MTIKTITLAIPDELYQQITQMAQITNRLIHELLTETIERAFPRVHINPNRQAMEQEVAAFERLHPTLWKQYPHQYVALHQGKVIDHDPKQLALIERIDQAYPQTAVILIRQLQPQPLQPLRFRSPRWVK